MEQRPRLLIIGAAKNSLGRAVYEAALDGHFDVTTAGIHRGDETHAMDVTDSLQVAEVMMRVAPEHVVCTAGINTEAPARKGGLDEHLERLMQVNALGPMRVLRAWADVVRLQGDALLPGLKHFVAISSNSAHIARTGSAAYCMSKAALSMGVRVAGRELAGTGHVVYGYEPGWLEGTPMSVQVTRRLARAAEGHVIAPLPHRIPGGMGVDPYRLARLIVHNLQHGGAELNGTLIRIDGGEQ